MFTFFLTSGFFLPFFFFRNDIGPGVIAAIVCGAVLVIAIIGIISLLIHQKRKTVEGSVLRLFVSRLANKKMKSLFSKFNMDELQIYDQIATSKTIMIACKEKINIQTYNCI